MKYIAFLAISMICLSGCNEKEQESISTYHALINQAELLISCFKYEEAHSKYLQAFKFKQLPFADDIYNRMYCAYYAKNTDDIFHCAKMLVSNKGLSIDLITKKYFLLQEYPDRWQEFLKWYPSGIEKFEKNCNQELMKLCRKIQVDDQKYRVSENRYTTLLDKNNQMDSLNLERLKYILDNYGYPTEEMIGILEMNEGYKGFQGVLDITILHAFQQFNKPWNFAGSERKVDLVNILELEVKNGNLHPEFYAHSLSGMNTHYGTLQQSNLVDPPIVIIENNQYIKPIDNIQNIDSINQIRKKLFLDPLEDFFKKSYFNFKNPNSGFYLSKQGCCITYHLKYPDQEQMHADILGVVPVKENQEEFQCN